MSKQAGKVVCLLLSGGAGTRLWPLSTEARPKQFLPLFGALSLYQMTLSRVRDVAVDGTWVVANAGHVAMLQGQAAAIEASPPHLVLEPMRRDSAAAIAAGVSAILTAHGPETVVIALPCDHMIHDRDGFVRTMREGVRLAREGFLGTFGIQPTFPSPDFGYLQTGSAVGAEGVGLKVVKFHEKPAPDIASGYLLEGGYFWNSGMFVFSAAGFVSEASRHMPDIWQPVAASVAGGRQDGHTLFLDPGAFSNARATSIDYALFEKSARVAMVRAGFDWSDVGNWAAAADALASDADRNVFLGDVVTLDVSNCLLIGEGTRILATGLNDLCVVATTEGVFVAPRDRAADVKTLLAMRRNAT